jgi:hypothetical protein
LAFARIPVIALPPDRSETVIPAELLGVLAPYLGSPEARLGRASETTFGGREAESPTDIFRGDSAERFPAAKILNSAGGSAGQDGQANDDGRRVKRGERWTKRGEIAAGSEKA